MTYPAHLRQFHLDRNTKAFYKSQSFKKMWNSFYDSTKKKAFQTFILQLRGKYKIPQNGFKINGNKWTTPPAEWAYEMWDTEHKEIQNAIKDFCRNQQIPSKDWSFSIEQYLFFNQIFISPEPNSHNVCYITDISTKQDSLGQELNDDLTTAYPVGLLISPYASQRDILAYVKDIYTTEIVPLQEKYKKEGSLIGKSRGKMAITRKRNELIWQNRERPLKEIMEVVKKECGLDADVGSIGKILSLERKARS
ncbi:MAG: hypothetical protein AAB383_03790 [Patescibacteria group bacterium]